MEAPVGVQACNQAPRARQALCNRSLWLCAHGRREAVPPGGAIQAECCSGIALSQRSVLLECLGGGSEHEHVGMSPCSPEHQVSSWVCLPQGQGPDCTAVLICAVNVFGLVFVVTEFPLQD